MNFFCRQSIFEFIHFSPPSLRCILAFLLTNFSEFTIIPWVNLLVYAFTLLTTSVPGLITTKHLFSGRVIYNVRAHFVRSLASASEGELCNLCKTIVYWWIQLTFSLTWSIVQDKHLYFWNTLYYEGFAFILSSLKLFAPLYHPYCLATLPSFTNWSGLEQAYLNSRAISLNISRGQQTALLAYPFAPNNFHSWNIVSSSDQRSPARSVSLTNFALLAVLWRPPEVWKCRICQRVFDYIQKRAKVH